MRNTGKPAEDSFEAVWRGFGKAAVVHRFEDTHGLTSAKAARTGESFRKSMVFASEQPADYLVIEPGGMYFAEVKSISKMTFPFSMFKRGQLSMGQRASTAREGSYNVFIRCELDMRWWCVPWRFIQSLADQGFKSFRLQDLPQEYLWRAGNDYEA